MRKLLASAALIAAFLTLSRTGWAADKTRVDQPEIARVERVLLISIDGMHALDLANYIKANPNSTLATLAGSGVNYTNASTTKPSDSFPAMAGIVTGGSPAVTGIYYDDAYNRALVPASDVNCTGPRGVRLDLKEGYDRFPDQLDAGGIDPAKLPRDPDKGCVPVFPHNLMRVNTIFEVARAAGLHTAYSEKRPSYDILNGPSGLGVADLYTPEIAFDGTLQSLDKTIAFDDLRVESILREIKGRTSDGLRSAPVPAIFGMNFQAINSAKKENVPDDPGGYAGSFGSPSAGLLRALAYTDQSIGRMVEGLKREGLLDTTAIIVTAKHGETPLDPAHRTIVLTSTIPGTPKVIGILNGMQPPLVAAQVTQKANAIIWLKKEDQGRTVDAVKAILKSPANVNFGQVLSGESLKLLFPDPQGPDPQDPHGGDPAVPDIIVVTNTGVNFEPKLTSTTMAEHGGFGENDTHVPLLVSIPGITPAVVQAPVQTTQIAPTVMRLLKLKPSDLDAVRLEGTTALPRFDKHID